MKSQFEVRVYRLNFGCYYCCYCYCCGHEEHRQGEITPPVLARAVASGAQAQARAQAGVGRAGHQYDRERKGPVQAQAVWAISQPYGVRFARFLNRWNHGDESYIYTPNLGSESIREGGQDQIYRNSPATFDARAGGTCFGYSLNIKEILMLVVRIKYSRDYTHKGE